MKKQHLICLVPLAAALMTLFSCTNRSSDDVWEDTKTAGRHLQKGVRSLGGKHGDSRQVNSRDEFCCIDDNECIPPGGFSTAPDSSQQYFGGMDEAQMNDEPQDFVPLSDPNGELQSREWMARPARETPGESGSSIPGIAAFRDPATNPQWAGVFQPVYFEYDSSAVKGQRNLNVIHNIVGYLSANPNIYIFIEGHTDERGPQAYNMALAARRANIVRNMIAADGISPDRLFTIAYGKERPVVLEQHEEAWSKNRRAEFKIYER